jgi:hypothetical protein
MTHQRAGKGTSCSGSTSDEDVLYTIAQDMDTRLFLQGGPNGIDGEGTSASAAAVRKDYKRLMAAIKAAGISVTDWGLSEYDSSD